MDEKAAKVILRHCEFCKKETEHTIPFAGVPFICSTTHFTEPNVCSNCGRNLPVGKTFAGMSMNEIAKALGATILCHICRQALPSPFRKAK